MSWSTDNFRDILKEYERLYNQTDNDKDRDKLLDYICNMKYEIAIEELTKFEREKLDNKDESSNINNVLTDEDELNLDKTTCFGELTHDIYDMSKYINIYPYIEEFKTKLKNLLKYDSYKFREPGKLKLSKNDIFELIHDLFKSTTKEIYNKYLELEKEKDSIVELDASIDTNDGSSYYFPIVNKRFISVGTKGDSEELLSTLAHEFGHSIGSMYNGDRYVNGDFFLEIESQFFELIANDYFANKINKNYYEGLSKEILYDYYSNAKGFIANRDILDEVFNKLNTVDNPYEYYTFLVDNNTDYKTIDIPEKTKYLFGYIVALELFEIYKDDKELAIELLKNIICKDDNRTELSRITNNIDINSRIEKHVKRLRLERN